MAIRKTLFVSLLLACSTLLHAATTTERLAAASKAVTTDTIANKSDDDWLSYGGDYHEQRFSQLKQITDQNIGDLGLAWSFDTDYDRGLEATPLVVDGVMYVSGNWSVVYALDAKTGELLWKHDPQVPKEWGKMACCDVVNRGVALYEGKVFVGTLDARLVALDAATGEVIWDVQTADIKKYPYTITGAPRAAKGKVFIGNGGAEYGVRGFVSAFDTDTGEMVWRFYTVPGNPADGFETPALEEAAKSWSGEWWKAGGGGTVWDSIVYDPELDQLYIGVGNGSPWDRNVRSPGGGDNLYLSSIVALNPDTGEHIWHYQETPAETWDYTATQHIMLADMEWQGQQKKVIWHAPKNGFFFIIDRTNGKLLSAEPYSKVTWATHYDMETGRPVERPEADYTVTGEPTYLYPSSMGAHNWQPMAHHPDTGLVYIPATESMFRYEKVFENQAAFEYEWGHWNIASVLDQGTVNNAQLGQKMLPLMAKGYLLAWDPKNQQEVWRVPQSLAWSGGVLATAGNLLFQGNPDKELAAYAADTGNKLWAFDAQTGVVGSPVTFTIDGEQYVSVPAGWGGAFGLTAGIEPGQRPEKSRILTFKLGAKATLPALPPLAERKQPPARVSEDSEVIDKGRELYAVYCFACHGQDMVSNGSIPDLRRLPTAFYDNFNLIVLEGAMSKLGMVGFKDVLSEDDAFALKAHILDEANKDWELNQQPAWWLAIKDGFYGLLSTVLGWMASMQAS
mgnify:CR=1 FL=1